MKSIDLNCDLGEGFPCDAELMPLITSANIACGAHAGDGPTMVRTIALAKQHGVQVGAHPGYADRAHMGRQEMNLSGMELIELITPQIRLMQELCGQAGVPLRHVKPHGALYNQAARDPHIARAIVRAVASVDANLVLVGLAGSEVIRAGEAGGLKTAAEIFADRAYEPDGTLVPRSKPGSVLHGPDEIRRQLQALVERQVGQTICLHGDTPGAPEVARQIREILRSLGLTVQPVTIQPV